MYRLFYYPANANLAPHILLEEGHPEAKLAPPLGSEERAHFYQWLALLTNTIQPDYMAYRHPEKHTSDASGTNSVREQAERRLEAGFAVLENALEAGPYLFGGRTRPAVLRHSAVRLRRRVHE